jgi:uncharacterized protein YbjT (DUF2867 family)
MSDKPKVLVMGVTGQLGGLISEMLREEKAVDLIVTSRRKEQVEELKAKFGEAVFMDLDEPRSFPAAFSGVERIFLLTGYSVTMLVQSKAVIDAAKKAGVKHIVHLGVFSLDEDCYDPHFAWHQMIEVYLKASGIAYTLLHPNCFMQNFTGFYGMAQHGKIRFYAKDKRVGWIALEDLAEAAARILVEGPAKHHGKDYWFSTDSLSSAEVARIFTEVTGEKFVDDSRPPEQFMADMGPDRNAIDAYFVGVEESFKQIVDGRMAYIADVRDDMPLLVGRKGMMLREWAQLHKDEILKAAK